MKKRVIMLTKIRITKEVIPEVKAKLIKKG
jgi:hypothetical protein